jgi:hypothetical protein
MLRIAILDDYQSVAQGMTDWSRIGPDAEIVSFNRHLSEAQAADELAAFDVLCIMRERMALPRSLIQALPRLKLIAVTGSHTQVIDKEAAQERGIPVTLTSPRASYSAAELTWAMVLGLARQITLEDRNMREGRWQTSVGFRLEGRTLGLIGLGTLGARVARADRARGKGAGACVGEAAGAAAGVRGRRVRIHSGALAWRWSERAAWKAAPRRLSGAIPLPSTSIHLPSRTSPCSAPLPLASTSNRPS